VLILWAGGLSLYLAAFVARRPAARADWRAWWRTYRAEALGLGAITLAGAFARLYQLGSLPRVINGDEGLLGQAALLTRQLPLANPFASFENFGALYLQGVHLAVQIFRQTPFALRLLPALGGVLALPALYLLARWLFGPRTALFASGLLAVAHAHIHFSRIVAVGYIQGTWLIPLELYFFLSGLQKRSALRLALSGLLLGIHFNIYLSAQVIAPMLLVYLLVAYFVCRPLVQDAARQIPALGLGLLLAGLPYAVQAALKPDQFFSRLNTDGTFQSGWLQQTMAESGRSAVEVLAERAAHAFLSLNFYPALDFYGARAPLLDFVTSVLFLLGLGYALWRTRDPGYLLLNGYFWSVTLAVGIFSVPPSADSYRMLIALPAAILLAAVGLERLIQVITPWGTGLAAARVLWVAGLLTATLVLNLRTYFMDFAAQCRYGGDPQTRFASYLGNYLRTQDRVATLYLLSDGIFRHGTHSSVDFLSRNRPVQNWDAPLADLAPAPGSVIIANPNRAEELKTWTHAHPGGRLHEEVDCQNLMLLAYEMP
jgi:4-amino-4-deoxy-L-arabinose transferase-like glycosyltransferase